ncbi:hypothetical protein Bca101_082672 [Brassica carinata]
MRSSSKARFSRSNLGVHEWEESGSESVKKASGLSGFSVRQLLGSEHRARLRFVHPLTLTYAYIAPPPVCPASSVIEDDLVEWRSKYSLPPHVILWAPTSEERASIHAPGEIAVYAAFFETGLRGVVPALIVGLCDLFEISPSLLNLPAIWLPSTEERGIYIFVLAVACRSWRSYQKPSEKDRPSIKKWAERYAFMSLPGSTYQWNIIGSPGTHPAPSEGESTVLRARQLPLDRRQVDILVGETVLRRSILWRNMSGSVADDSFAAYEEAAKVMSAKRGSASRTTVSQLFHIGERLSTEDASSVREELEVLKREAFEEKDRRMALELEVRDLKKKLKASEKNTEEASADELATSQENQKLAEDIKTAAENFKLEMVMALNGALDQYKTVVLEEAKNKGIAPPSFDDEPAIPSSYEMDVESSAKH